MKRVIRRFSALTLALFACAPTYHAEAVFTSAPLLPPGTPIMVGEHVIGKTATTSVIAGMLHVNLALNTPDALPDETILVLERAPQGLRLVAHPSGNPLHVEGKTRVVFLAVTSQREYWQLRLQRQWEQLTR